MRDQLHLATFKRLNLGLVLQTGATLVVGAQAISLRNNVLTGGEEGRRGGECREV